MYIRNYQAPWRRRDEKTHVPFRRWSHERCYFTPIPVSTGVGDHADQQTASVY